MSSKRRKLGADVVNAHSTTQPNLSLLLSCPIEVLDQILFHVTQSPSHIKNATHPKQALRSLFTPTLWVNRQLRQRSIQVIARNTLWIDVEYLALDVYIGRFQALRARLPVLPQLLQTILPTNTVRLSLRICQATSREPSMDSSTTPLHSFLFPYNPHSFIDLCFTMLKCYRQSPHIDFLLPSLLSPLQFVVHQHIKPLFKILSLFTRIKVVNLFVTSEYSLSTHEPGFQIDTIMSVIQHLDQIEATSEATLVALYFGKWFTQGIWFQIQDWILSWGVMTLTSDDYITNQNCLEWIRLGRTINYIERRACMAYLSGVRAHKHDFLSAHSEQVLGMNLLDLRWFSDDFLPHIFGIPDVELAELHHMLATMYSTDDCWNYDSGEVHPHHRIRDNHTHSPRNYLRMAVENAYLAWRLDKRSIKYASTFQCTYRTSHKHRSDLIGQISPGSPDPSKLRFVSTSNLKPTEYRSANAQKCLFWGSAQLLTSTINTSGDPQNVQWLPRANEVAKKVDVAYDARRGNDFVDVHMDEHEEARILNDLLQRLGTRLDFEKYGIPERDIEEYLEAEKANNMWL